MRETANSTAPGAAGKRPRLEVLITAREAYPAFEALVMEARDEVVMGFRVFDPLTRLRSAPARAVGQTWADLLAHTLARGVKVTLHLADFDPLAAPDLHAGTWRAMRILCAVRELAGPGAAPLVLRPALHPSRIGAVPAMLLRPLVAARMRRLQRQGGTGRGTEPGMLPGLRHLRRLTGRLIMPSYPASHHHKLAVIDGKALYIGGLDLDERRYDDPGHNRAAQDTWHDVQLVLRDAVLARAALCHLNSFGEVTAGRAALPPAPGLIRTLSARRRGRNLWAISPRPVAGEIAEAHQAAIATSQTLIYLETQFFRDRGLTDALVRRAAEAPDLRLLLVIPAAPETVAFTPNPTLDGRYGDHLQTRCLRRLRRAYGVRLLIASPAVPRPAPRADTPGPRARLRDAPVVYVHAKLSVFDRNAAIVSSANLNGRSLRWDTEAGICLIRPGEVGALQQRCFAHWYGDAAIPDAMKDPARAFDCWSEIVARNLRVAPRARQGFLLPYDMAAAIKTALPVPGVPEDMV